MDRCSDRRKDDVLGRSPQELIEDQVARTPDAPAVGMGATRLSYRELNARANQLANFLREQGVGPEKLVGVYMDRSVEMLVSFLAILKAGGVYLPLDPKFPSERLAFMLADAEVSLVLTQSAKCASLPQTTARVIAVDDGEDRFAQYPSGNLSSVGRPEQLAYMIYTSGSTGKPKGVMIPRSALVNFLFSMAEAPGISAQDVLLAVTTISFDISILELLLPLIAGAQVIIASREQAGDDRELKKLINDHAVTLMQATPTTWRMLVETGWEGKSDLKILCGGEALPSDLARQLLPRCRELWNMYGPTETTIWSSVQKVTSSESISMGSPIANTQFYVADESQKPVPDGGAGELLIGGKGLACGYLKRPELTAEKFIPDTISGVPGARLYRTGDEVRFRSDGSLEFLGRLDHQVKLRGFRIELGEIESRMAQIDGIRQAVAIVREDRPGDKSLVAYYTGREGLTSTGLLQTLKSVLPEYMIPSAFVRVEQFPLTPNAKLDRKALPPPRRERPLLAQDYIAPRTALEKQLATVWCEFLQLDKVGIDDSFFDLGGNSVAVVRMANSYRSRFGREIPPVKVFQYPTIAQLSSFLDESEPNSAFVRKMESRTAQQRQGRSPNDPARDAVAIIGMVGRFPGAENLDQLWSNLRNGVESISFFSPQELGPGVEEHLRNDPDYIRARGIIDGAELFDASFFGISPLEAKVMDPQQRVFLELAHQALENAGYDPDRYKGLIGIFAGIGDNHYYTTNLLAHPDLLSMAGKLAVEYGNQKDYVALRAAYLLDLRGPAISLNTACSTTLLAADHAFRSLLDFECDIALAGGVDITVPQKSGFLYQEGGTFAKDGHCRPFDADATGTMFCDGAGIVVLKRLADAIADGDTIYAVIRGTGKNNNGARPASFLAPSVEGQAEAIAMAQARAGIDVETIGYIEAHGTGTPVGDPIEIEALSKVFQSKTSQKQFCHIGSIKGNIGHPTNAAGVAGLIKAALVLHHEEIPATLHFKTPNPKIDFANSPFKIADKLIPYARGKQPRRTAVSSFGFGGTNVHVILEEAPLRTASGDSRPLQLIPVSAKTPAALDAYSRSLAAYFENAFAGEFADAAFTLQRGRKQMAQRRFVVAAGPGEAAQLLKQPNPLRCSSKRCERRDPPIVFLFGGQGTQYVNMGLNLYRDEPLFRAIVDDCCEFLKPHLGRDLRELLYPAIGDEETARISLQDTFYTQPSIFVIEYALARFWQSLGVQPAMMAGHSIGEFVAATLAGVMDLQDALRIIALRGRLMQILPRGSMLAVSAGADKVQPLLPLSLQIASNNAPSLCVVSGPEPDVKAFAEQLQSQDIVCRQLHTSHAFHSAMMDPVVEPLRAEVARLQLHPPAQPFVSTVTGRLIMDSEATDPAYWARHARATVEFSKATQCLQELGYDLFLECGPRSTLCSLTRQHFSPVRPCIAIPTLSDTHENNAEFASVLFALGSLWQNGVSIDWEAFYANEDRRRIPLPVYPFERRRFWVDPAPVVAGGAQRSSPSPLPESSAAGQEAAIATPATDLTRAAIRESRKECLAARLLDMLAPISGHERSLLDASETFLGQGFDSLSLTQVSLAIRKEFGVKVSFSQLMNQFVNVDMVAAHLDQTMPAGQFAAPPGVRPDIPASAAPAAVASSGQNALGRPASSSLEEIVAEQGRTIARLVSLVEKSVPRQPESFNCPASPVESAADAAKPAPAIIEPSAQPVEIESTVPQRGIYFSSRLSDHLSASYNESMSVRFTGNISIPKLTRAVERLVERHDALRTSFDESGSVMRIAPATPIRIPVTDLSTLPDAENRDYGLAKLITLEMAQPFALPGGPLFRSQIAVLGPDVAVVILTGHHIICDGWSLDVLIHDLCAFYSEGLSGVPLALPSSGRFGDYAREVAQRAQSEEFLQAREYWYAKFAAGFPALVLPADQPRSGRRQFAARRLDRIVNPAVVQNLRALGARQGCSFFAVILGSLSILLARASRQRRFVLALPTAEQPVLGQPELVGHCVNLLPFVVDLREGESAGAFLDRVQRDLGAAHDHSAFTLVNLLNDLRLASRVQGVSPVSAGLTGVKKFLPHELPQSGFSVDYDANPKGFESFEWYLNAIETGDGLNLRCHYDSGLFEKATIEEWLTGLDAILGDIAADTSREVLELARLNPAPHPASTRSDEVMYALPSSEGTSLRGSAHEGAASVPEGSAVSGGRAAAQQRPLVETVRDLFCEVLHLPSVLPDDDFFALGGHSMVAAQLFARLKSDLNFSAPLSSLYEASTPRQLAGKLSAGTTQRDWKSLVPISPSGTRPPLFLVHGGGGNVLMYRDLGRLMAPDYPLYALQAQGLDGSKKYLQSIEDMAAHYLREILDVQPAGPYQLGGFCMGAQVAFEIAQRLVRSGQKVSLLISIDSYNFNGTALNLTLKDKVRTAGQKIRFHSSNLAHLSFSSQVSYFAEKFKIAHHREMGRLRVKTNGLFGRNSRGSKEEFLEDINDRAMYAYVPCVYPGKMTIFKPHRNYTYVCDLFNGWGNVVAGGLEVVELPVDPGGIFTEPYVQTLAEKIKQQIDAASVRSAERPMTVAD